MIEIRFAFFPTNQGKLCAVMIAMAGGAEFDPVFCLAGVRHRDASVIPALGLQAFGNGDVTLQAFGVAGLLANFMARQTLRQTFKLGMRRGQRAGRNLRNRSADK